MKKNNPATGTKIIAVVGPTASGKSDLGIKLARKFNGEIISADSRQVYKGMDIGTGKVPKDGIKKLRIPDYGLNTRPLNSKFAIRNSKFHSGGIRHHLLDVASPKKQFTVADFKRLGEKAIKEIVVRNKTPIIVGGTGFYVDILLGRMQAPEVPPDHKLRAELEKQSAEQLFKRLSELDPLRAGAIDRNNPRRLIRALEIVLGTGRPVPNYELRITNYETLWLGIDPGKERLAKNIKKRLDARLKEGMIEEVAELHSGGVSWKRLDDMGLEYRWISRWLIKIQNAKFKMQNDNAKFKSFKQSEYYDRLLSEIIKYSKRQMTWFKRNKEICWIKNEGEAVSLIQKFL